MFLYRNVFPPRPHLSKINKHTLRWGFKKLSGLSLNAVPIVPMVDPNYNLDYVGFTRASRKKLGQFRGSEEAVLTSTREAQSL